MRDDRPDDVDGGARGVSSETGGSRGAPDTREVVGLYVHVAFCQTKCFYCDFNTYAGLQHLIPRYTAALTNEIAMLPHFPPGAPGPEAIRVGSIFFGGGTPSLLAPSQLASVLDAAARRFDVAADAEITVEANPNDLSLDYLRSLRDVGVNRMSVGVQCFDDALLRRLGRRHDAEGAVAALEATRSAGFDNLSIDLMFALPGQDLANWQASVYRAISFAPEHISLYNLTIEPDTPFAEWHAAGKLAVPDEDTAAEMYEWTIAHLDAVGYEHYEISNWARRDPHRDFRAQHNLRYWRNQPYLGIGAGAHSCFAGARFSTVLAPTKYLQLVEQRQSSVAEWEEVSRERAMAETLMLGLRLSEGVSLSEFRSRFGCDLFTVFGETVAELSGYGLLERRAERLRLTHRGKLLGNEVFQRFLEAPVGKVS